MDKTYRKRVYNKWTPEEDEMIRQGIIPPNHPSHANCLTRARKLGFKFIKKRQAVRWSEQQDNMIRNGIIPPNKGLQMSIERAAFLGFDFMEKFYENGNVDSVKGLSKEDMMLVMSEKNNSIKRYKVRMTDAAKEAAERGRKYFLMHAKSDMSIKDIAAKEHCTKQNVHRLIDTFKIHFFNEHCYDKVVEETDETDKTDEETGGADLHGNE